MIIYNIFCLVITLLVIQTYISMDVHTHTHRLLPLVLGLCGVFNFYEIFRLSTGNNKLFQVMEYLLLIQILYLLLSYAIDFLHISITKWVDILLFISLICIDHYILYHYDHYEEYRIPLMVTVAVYEILILLVGTYSYFKNSYTKRDIRISTAIYSALLFPSFGAFLRVYVTFLPDFVLPGAVAISCLIILYLIMTEQLHEPTLILHEQIYTHSELPLILFDQDFYFLSCNKAAEKVFPKELSDGEKNVGSFSQIQTIKKLYDQNKEEIDIPIQNQVYRCSLTPIYHKKKIHGYLLTFINITDQKNENREMAEKKVYAEQQTLLKSQFLARMSHDLRTPLHAIIGISDVMINRRDLSIKNHELITQINTSGKNLLELVNSILDYSKLEAKKLELANQFYHIDTIFSELAQMCYINLGNKPVSFSMSVETDFYNNLYGDPLRVREIIQNILSNSMKYTNEGSINCVIKCKNVRGSALFTCEVTDTGRGMTQYQLDQIFKEYSTYSASTSEESTGLGMTIVRQLIDLMGGDIQIESDGKTGTKVIMTFYQKIEEESLSPATKYGDNMKNVSMEPSVKKIPSAIYPDATVLIADDMDINIQVFTELTSPWKFKVESVRNGEEAIEIVKTRKYDLIFLDMLMPGMTGLEVAPKIKEITDTPMILLSANLITDAKKEYRECGFVDTLAKPIHLGALKRILEKHLPDSKKTFGNIDEIQNFDSMNEELRARITDAFINEMTPLADSLWELFNTDISLFRSKVHGIKGASRQLSRPHLAESAEIMEMAAKTENYDFIKKHLGNFIDELQSNIYFMEKKRKAMKVPEKEIDSGLASLSKVELFAKCKKGFDFFDCIEVENAIVALSHKDMTKEETDLLEKVKEIIDNLDYEDGSLLLQKYVEESLQPKD